MEGYLRWRYACPVGQEYAAVQAGVLACRCPMGRLHITAEHCLMEVLDPHTLAPLPAGETGVLAVTDWCNTAQPRLRYLPGGDRRAGTGALPLRPHPARAGKSGRRGGRLCPCRCGIIETAGKTVVLPAAADSGAI